MFFIMCELDNNLSTVKHHLLGLFACQYTKPHLLSSVTFSVLYSIVSSSSESSSEMVHGCSFGNDITVLFHSSAVWYKLLSLTSSCLSSSQLPLSSLRGPFIKVQSFSSSKSPASSSLPYPLLCSSLSFCLTLRRSFSCSHNTPSTSKRILMHSVAPGPEQRYAYSIAVTPSLSEMSGSPPCNNRSSRVSLRPQDAAMWTGVRPS